MKKFLLRIILFCAIPLPLLVTLDYAVDKGLHKSRYLYYADWNDLFKGKINADMLILGSSRAYLHVSPQILDSILHINSYNLGMDGAAFDIQWNILKLYLQHNKKPKYILQEVGYTPFVLSDSVQYYQEFISYIDDTAVWHILKSHYSSLGPAERYFPLYRYNGNLPFVKEGLMSFLDKGSKDVKYKGYEARDYPWDSSFYQFKKSNPHGMVVKIDSGLVILFGQYLDYCADNNIQVILFYAPTYYQSIPYILNNDKIQKMIVDCAATHHVPFLDYTSDSMNYDRSLFYNARHLNKKGAELFSMKLANDANRVIDSTAR